MSTLDSFLGYVRPWAPGVPDPTAYKAIRGAAIEFCERTRLWKYEDDFDVSVEDCNSGIFTPNGSVVHDIEVVLHNGHELLPKATRDLDMLEKGWRIGETSGGIPKYFTQIDQSTLRIVPALEGHLYLCLRLKPSQDANDIPDFISREYNEVIGWGALGRILTIPGQSYSNPELATYYSQKFTDKIDRLSNKGTTGQQNAPKRSRGRFF
jgi:hypothetical protein